MKKFVQWQNSSYPNCLMNSGTLKCDKNTKLGDDRDNGGSGVGGGVGIQTVQD